MSAHTIHLPDDLEDRVRERIGKGDYADVEEFIVELVRAETELLDSVDRWSGDPHVEQLVLEGLASGDAGPMTRADWDRLRRPYVQNSEQN